MRYNVNAWLGLFIGIAAGAWLGAVIGALSFRSGLKGSYFALVTLAFAEVLRILASVVPFTGAGVGTLIKLDLRPEAFQFQSRAPFYWIILGMVALSIAVVRMVQNTRFGAYLVAVRENEDAARALGVDTTRIKLVAMTISAAITAAGGCLYVSIFCSSMRVSPTGLGYRLRRCWRRSLAASARPGPLLGALMVKTLGELTKLVTGDAPGLDLVIYGCVLILVVVSRRAGLPACWRISTGVCGPTVRRPSGDVAMAEALLNVQSVSKRFGGLLAVDQASLTAELGRITALIGPNGAGKTTLFSIISGFLSSNQRAHHF